MHEPIQCLTSTLQLLSRVENLLAIATSALHHNITNWGCSCMAEWKFISSKCSTRPLKYRRFSNDERTKHLIKARKQRKKTSALCASPPENERKLYLKCAARFYRKPELVRFGHWIVRCLILILLQLRVLTFGPFLGLGQYRMPQCIIWIILECNTTCWIPLCVLFSESLK